MATLEQVGELFEPLSEQIQSKGNRISVVKKSTEEGEVVIEVIEVIYYSSNLSDEQINGVGKGLNDMGLYRLSTDFTMGLKGPEFEEFQRFGSSSGWIESVTDVTDVDETDETGGYTAKKPTCFEGC